MAPFVPPEPPIVPDTPEPPPALETPLPEPEVGFGSPWAPIDAENRDRILAWWRMWFLRVFFPWIKAWAAYWAAQWARIVAYLNEWLDYAAQYIEDHAVNGHSWWKTTTPIAATGTTIVEIPYDEFRPILIGDLVSDTTDDIRYGQVTALVDNTHAEVTPLGVMRGLQGFAGHGWWTTSDTITHSGTTDVVLTVDPTRSPQLGDIVVDSSDSVAYGTITVVTDATHVTVAYVGTLQGPPGVASTGSFNYTTMELQPKGDPGDTYQGQMAGQPNMVGAFIIETTAPAWVRIYASENYMLADETRNILTPLNIADDHGCYLDFVSIPSELTKTLTPGIQFTDTGSGLWLSIQNTDINDPAIIQIHLDYRIFRE